MPQILIAMIVLAVACAAHAQSLSLKDLEGGWRLSAASAAKYGCDNPGAMTVTFKMDGQGGLTGTYASPGMPGTFRQRFQEFASMSSMIAERAAGGRAVTLDAPGALRRILAVETEAGSDGRPAKLEWRSAFGGFGEEDTVFTQYTTAGWLTRCPN
jgi:hypothetical protein